MAGGIWRTAVSGLILVLLMPRDTSLMKAQSTEPPKLCYAFLKGNTFQASDLYVTCGAEHERITKVGDIYDFAVAADESVLALERRQGTEKGPGEHGHPTPDREFKIELVSLKPGFERHWSALPATGPVEPLYSYCGSILAVDRQRQHHPPPAKDIYKIDNVLTGQPFSLPPYVAFGCSEDGKTVVGLLDVDAADLWLGLPPERKIARSSPYGIYAYGISPNGEYESYESEEGLCVGRDGECSGLTRFGVGATKISVSDWGGVLYDDGTAKTCAGWECIGVFYWKAGMHQPQNVEPVGWFAQWITPEVANAIRAWSKGEARL